MTGSTPDAEVSSAINKVAKSLYNLVSKKKNRNKGQDWIMEEEKDFLEGLKFDAREASVEGKENEEKETEDEGELRSRKRKEFEEVCRSTKHRRVKNVVEILDEDPGLEDAVTKRLKSRKESENADDNVSQEFKLAVLSLMKTLNLSEKKLDDLRYWIQDMLRRGMDLSKMPHYHNLRRTTIQEMIPDGFSSSSTGATIPVISALHHTAKRFLLRPDIRSKLQDGDEIVHLAKIGSDYATGHGRMNQKKTEDYDEDGSHNSAYQTLQLSTRGTVIFKNENPGGNELLRMTSKTMEKDTKEKMAANMKEIDKLIEDMEDQVEIVPGVGQVTIKHKLINSMHDGKERLAAVTAKLEEYLEQGISKKPAGFGEQNKISTSTCMVCLTPPSTYNNPDSLSASPIMFEDIKNWGLSSMHMYPRCFECLWNSAVDEQVQREACTRDGKPCSLHPHLCPPSKGNRASMCKARDSVKENFQEKFKKELGLRCFYPEPQKGGNSNTGPLAKNVFKNSKVSSTILGVPEELLKLLWDLLKSINSSHMQDVSIFKEKSVQLFNMWIQVFRRPMTANLHTLIAHGADYIR